VRSKAWPSEVPMLHLPQKLMTMPNRPSLPAPRQSRSVARHDRSANSQEFGVMAMISSCGPPRFAGWTAAILLASATTAFADCGDLLQRFNQALEQRSLAEVMALEKQIAADAACGNRL